MRDEPLAQGERAPPAAQARAIGVFVAVTDQAIAARVAAALDGERFHLHTAAGQRSRELVPDIIVTDQSLASEELSGFTTLLMRGHVGVLLIGRTLPADVALPQDFTRRELRLACRLLAQVVTLRRQNQRLEALACIDPLTGLPNRRALESTFTKLSRSELPLALALFDVDHFKRINARFGYLRGDDVLRAAAKTLIKRAQPHFVARLGGDEFVVLWHETDANSALTFAEQLRAAIGFAAGLTAANPVTASAGVVLVDTPEALTSLLGAADGALRRAKEQGGNRAESA